MIIENSELTPGQHYIFHCRLFISSIFYLNYVNEIDGGFIFNFHKYRNH